MFLRIISKKFKRRGCRENIRGETQRQIIEMRLSGCKAGLLMNFNVLKLICLKKGCKRLLTHRFSARISENSALKKTSVVTESFEDEEQL